MYLRKPLSILAKKSSISLVSLWGNTAVLQSFLSILFPHSRTMNLFISLKRNYPSNFAISVTLKDCFTRILSIFRIICKYDLSFCSIWEIISIIDKDSMDYFFIVDIIWIKFTWYWYCPITTPPRMDNIWDQLSLQLDGSVRTLFLRSCVSYFTYTYWVEKEAVFRGNI